MLNRATAFRWSDSLALAGLAAENMARTSGWRFHDLGRRLEAGGGEPAGSPRPRRRARTPSIDDLATLLDIADSQISYRARYPEGIALDAVRDLILLDPWNPRSLAYQVERIAQHLGRLPALRDDGMPEAQVAMATRFSAGIATAEAATMDGETMLGLENRLYALSERDQGALFPCRGRAGPLHHRCGSHDLRRHACDHLRYDAPMRYARCNLEAGADGMAGADADLLRAGGVAAGADHAQPCRRLCRPYRARGGGPAGEQLVITARARLRGAGGGTTFPGDPGVAEVAAMALASEDLGMLSPPANFIYPSPMIPLTPEITEWCASSLAPERGVVEAAYELTRRIKQAFHYDTDATETDTTPADAFTRKAGVCQDYAQVMIAGLRAAGLPAAYVSGYLRTIPPPGKKELVGADATHAWVMLWCGPARGWIGFDPTSGVGMNGDHIVTAVGRDYADIAPIDGIFVGQSGQSIKVSVDVRPLDEAA